MAHRIPIGRLHALARFANTARVSVIRRLPESRRLATLVAFGGSLEAAALDDALDLLDILITEMFSGAARASDKARLRTIKDLDAAAIQLTQVCRLVLDGEVQDTEVRSAIFKMLEREQLEAAVNQVDSLVRPPEDVYYRELAGSYARVRRFLPPLLRTIQFDGTPAGESVLEAINYLRQAEQGHVKAADAPMAIVNRGWRRYVGATEDIDRKAYVFCCLERVRTALRRRDIFWLPVSAMPMRGSVCLPLQRGTRHVQRYVVLWATPSRLRKQSRPSAVHSIRPIAQWLRICRRIQAPA